MNEDKPVTPLENADYDENTIWWLYALKKFSESAGGTISQRLSIVGSLLAFAVTSLLLWALIEHLFFL